MNQTFSAMSWLISAIAAVTIFVYSTFETKDSATKALEVFKSKIFILETRQNTTTEQLNQIIGKLDIILQKVKDK